MEKKIDWSKAPEGTTHFCHDAIDGSHWRDFSDTYAKYWHSGEWHDHHGSRSDALLSSSVRFEARPAAPTWPAEGVLPPVGTVCEVFGCEHEYTMRFNFQHVEIIAHHTDSEGDRVAVFAADDFEYHGLTAERFRPIKTAEQIAAEEKEAALDEMTDCTSMLYASLTTRRAIAAELYDAGYRKQ